MRRFLLCIGVCALLFVVNTEGSKTKNQKKFWELFDSDTSNNLPEKAEKKNKNDDKDFTIDDEEGSGVDLNVDTHEDDEDFDVSSGDGDQELDHIKVTQKPATTDDEDLYEESGSGMPVEEEIINVNNANTESAVPNTTVQSRPLSPCENLRISALDVADFVPECDDSGAFKNRQCMMNVDSYTHSCWCVTSNGAQIQGTLMNHPDVPDCDFGSNMKSCVFRLVQNGQQQLGAVKPRCTQNGDWESIQCHGSECWCVDSEGNQHPGSVTNLPAMPNCDPSTTASPITKKPKSPIKTLPNSKGGYTVAPSDTHVVVTDIVLEANNDDNGNLNREGYSPVKHNENSMFSQPGFLAAIIAGGVITLLLVVLLVMFIVYRMRKKDEGSYPLDEQKFQNYSYAKAPDKEFYA